MSLRIDIVFELTLAGGHGLMPRMVKLRVPPVPRLWGPGKGNRAVCCASTQAVASLSHRPSIPIRFLRFRAFPFDNGDSLTRATPQSRDERGTVPDARMNGAPADLVRPAHCSAAASVRHDQLARQNGPCAVEFAVLG